MKDFSMSTKSLFLEWQYKSGEDRPYFSLGRLDIEPSLYRFRYTGGTVRAPVGRIDIAAALQPFGHAQATRISFFFLKNWFFKEDIMGSEAIFAAMIKKDLHGVELLQTSDRIADIFMEHVIPTDLEIKKFYQSNEQLIQARDVLLPRLMSGEVAV